MVRNGNAYDEGLDNDFWKPLKAYWQEPNSPEKRDALRAFLTAEAARWQYTHGVSLDHGGDALRLGRVALIGE